MTRPASSVSPRPRTLAALAALSALATAAWLATPSVASGAQPAADVPQTIVYYSYSDLATDVGTRALYARIKSAAKTVCPGYDSRDLTAFAASKECQIQAVTHAVSEIGNARLAALNTPAVPRG